MRAAARSGALRWRLPSRPSALRDTRMEVWIEPRIGNPGVGRAKRRSTRGLVACLGPDPAPSPWGFVSGVGAQTGMGGWWWNGEVDSEGRGGSRRMKRQKREGTRTARAAADAGRRQGCGVGGGRGAQAGGQERAGAWQRRGRCARRARRSPTVACAAAVSDAASAAMASSPRQTAAAIVRTRHRGPLSPCTDRSGRSPGHCGCSCQAQAIARAQTFSEGDGVPWERSAHGYCPLAASAAHHAEPVSPPAPTPPRRRSPHSDDDRSARIGIGSLGLDLDRADDRH